MRIVFDERFVAIASKSNALFVISSDIASTKTVLVDKLSTSVDRMRGSFTIAFASASMST